MNTFINEGRRLPYSNTGSAISSGDVVILGGSIGIAVDDIAATTGTGVLEVEGVHQLAAASADTFAVGMQLYWSTANANLTTTATSNKKAGFAWIAKASGTVLAQVKLNVNV